MICFLGVAVMFNTISSTFLFLTFSYYVSYAGQANAESFSIPNFITNPKDDLVTRLIICSLIVGVYTLYWYWTRKKPNV
jgi:hypothetical protein